MKMREQDVIWRSPNGNVAVTYRADALGDKWSVYRKIYYSQYYDRDEFEPAWEYVTSFNGGLKATEYAKKMYDDNIYR